MNTTNQVYRSQQGSVLVGVMCFLFLATGLVTTILVLGSNHRKISQRQVNMEQAMSIAEAGMERGARFIESNIVVMVASSTGKTNATGSFNSGTFTYVITRTNNIFTIVSTGTVNSVSRTVTLKRVYQPTYAEFALWSATNGAIYFKNGEEFDGKVHADDKLYFNVSGGGPVFHELVTSQAGTYTVQGGSINDVEFEDGFNSSSYQGTMADVDFNSSASTSLKNIAQATGKVLDGTTTITFAGHRVKITNTREGWNNKNYTFNSANGIIYVRNATSGSSDKAGTVYFTGGVVTGRLTVVSETDMYIRGHIKYGRDPAVIPSSPDALGLISRDDVWVDTTAPNNLIVNAAIMATGRASATDDGSFGVIDYNEGSSRGTLNVYGGIVQQTRGAVGTFNSSTGATSTGYGKNYSYDPRFIDDPPPYYPTIANKVEFADWQEGR